MEFRKVSIGFDLESRLYYVHDSEFKFLTAEAKSLSALRQKLETLELRPVLSPIYGAAAPEFRRAKQAAHRATVVKTA